MTRFEEQRKNMVESQVRPSDVTDRRVIRAMQDVAREGFVPAAMRPVAYMDQDVSVTLPGAAGARRFLLAPRLFAKMVQALDLGERDAVLEVGTATGYGAAVLAYIARSVVALESDADLARAAAAQIAASRLDNVTVVTGDLTAGDPAQGPYDAILIMGAINEVPSALLDQLKDGGRLVAVVVEEAGSRLMQCRRLGGTFDARIVADATAPMLPGFQRAAAFVF